MLLDTSGLLCLLIKDEPEHADAVRCYKLRPARVVHNYIIAEFVPLARVRSVPRNESLKFIRRMQSEKSVALVWVDEETHHAGMELLFKRMDKAYSLCDAVSFVLMHERGITEALTTDRHFEQEGFTRLLA